MKPRICEACETVSHCSRHGCIPVQSARSGGKQGRNDPRSAAADRALMLRLWPLWVLIVVALIALGIWRFHA